MMDVLDKKIVLKTHLSNINISVSLEKLRQYNKSLTKHETKLETAINTK